MPVHNLIEFRIVVTTNKRNSIIRRDLVQRLATKCAVRIHVGLTRMSVSRGDVRLTDAGDDYYNSTTSRR